MHTSFSKQYFFKSWQRQRGLDNLTMKPEIDDTLGIEREHPGLLEQGMPDPAKYRYFSRTWAKRTSHLNVDGPPTKPF